MSVVLSPASGGQSDPVNPSRSRGQVWFVVGDSSWYESFHAWALPLDRALEWHVCPPVLLREGVSCSMVSKSTLVLSLACV